MKRILTLLLCTSLLLGALCTAVNATDTQTSADASATDTATDTATNAEQSTEQVSGETTQPTTAKYLFINKAMGYASGSVSFDMPEQSNASSFALYWADASGTRIANMTPFMEGDIISPTMSVYTTDAFSFPADAKYILLYTYSEQFGECKTPYKIEIGDYTLPEHDKVLGEYVIVSDLLIGSGKNAEKNFTAMLGDVKLTAPKANGIIVVGDAVDAAEEQNYLTLKQLYDKVEGVPPMYLGAGDRGYLTQGTYQYDAAKHAENLQLFLKYAGHPFGTKLEKPYYSYLLGGTLLVFIGADSYENGNAVYSREQLDWLTGVLDGADGFQPVLVFMHEPIPNTVSGSLTAQGYGNVHNHDELKAVFKEYKNLAVFSGHTQWQMEADRTSFTLLGSSQAFNTAGVANLWNDKNGAGYEVAGSQGYYVTVYENAVLVRGRDFTTGEWISSATYMFSTKPYVAPTPPSSPKPSTTKKPVDKEEETTDEANETGVRDLIPPLCILALMAAVVFIFIFRKPKDQV